MFDKNKFLMQLNISRYKTSYQGLNHYNRCILFLSNFYDYNKIQMHITSTRFLLTQR